MSSHAFAKDMLWEYQMSHYAQKITPDYTFSESWSTLPENFVVVPMMALT
jgi:hypothetical protein